MNDLRPDGTDPRWRLTPTKYVVAVLLLIGIVLIIVASNALVERRYAEVFR